MRNGTNRRCAVSLGSPLIKWASWFNKLASCLNVCDVSSPRAGTFENYCKKLLRVEVTSINYIYCVLYITHYILSLGRSITLLWHRWTRSCVTNHRSLTFEGGSIGGSKLYGGSGLSEELGALVEQVLKVSQRRFVSPGQSWQDQRSVMLRFE